MQTRRRKSREFAYRLGQRGTGVTRVWENQRRKGDREVDAANQLKPRKTIDQRPNCQGGEVIGDFRPADKKQTEDGLSHSHFDKGRWRRAINKHMATTLVINKNTTVL